jgi:hypothetical protein
MNSGKYAVVDPSEAGANPYPYVYVDADGAVRELHASERSYLEEPFHPADGGRPYVKSSFSARDGWGTVAGFCRRKHVPPDVPIGPAPEQDPNPPMSAEQMEDWVRNKLQTTASDPDRRLQGGSQRQPWWKFWT